MIFIVMLIVLWVSIVSEQDVGLFLFGILISGFIFMVGGTVGAVYPDKIEVIYEYKEPIGLDKTKILNNHQYLYVNDKGEYHTREVDFPLLAMDKDKAFVYYKKELRKANFGWFKLPRNYIDEKVRIDN